MSKQFSDVAGQDARFGFGANWARFLALVDDERIALAEQSLRDMLERENLNGLRHLDVGSGSGLFSLAARNLGAVVHSFDYDPQSVGCTQALRERYRPGDENWIIERGDALDEDYLAGLGTFDVVYSWGVLHHTGDMWSALENMTPLVNRRGQLFLALYNDQGGGSKRWKTIKRLYVNGSIIRKWSLVSLVGTLFELRRFVISMIRLQNPFKDMFSSSGNRGMSKLYDLVDWVGGHPFEVAKPEEVFEFFHERGFHMQRLKTCGGGHGCNEYVFRKHFSEG